MGFYVCKVPEMTWRQITSTYGSRAAEGKFAVLALYDELVEDGAPEEQACALALVYHGCLEEVKFTEDEKGE